MITLERADGSRRVGLWSLVGLLLVTGLWTTMTADLRQSFATFTPAI